MSKFWSILRVSAMLFILSGSDSVRTVWKVQDKASKPANTHANVWICILTLKIQKKKNFEFGMMFFWCFFFFFLIDRGWLWNFVDKIFRANSFSKKGWNFKKMFRFDRLSTGLSWQVSRWKINVMNLFNATWSVLQ